MAGKQTNLIIALKKAEYPLMATVDSLAENLIAIVEFKYDTNTCQLDFPCANNPTAHNDPVNTGLHVYPNPATDQIFIESTEAIKEVSLIHIATGLSLLQTSFSTIPVILPVSTTPPGSYLLQVTTQNGYVVAERVIISGR